jgi:hypothetical protein
MVDYASLKIQRPTLDPIAVQIEGLKEPLLIHLFTAGEIRQVMGGHALLDECKSDDEKNEVAIRIQVLYFLSGINAQITRAACDELTDIFTNWQVRDIYKKATTANGYGPASLGDALKNFERTLH